MRIQGNNFSTDRVFQYTVQTKKNKVSAHIHQYAELIFVIDGNIKITSNGKSEHLCAGDAALVFPYQVHSYDSKDINTIAVYLFSPSTIIEFMKSHEGKVGKNTKFTPSLATDTVFREKIFNCDDLSLYNVKAMLYLALNDYLEQNELENNISGTGVVSKVIVYMNEHFREPLNLSTVASALGYSANYLSHCIKRLYGMNFCSLLASLRIEKARHLLTETNKSCTEICYECGFGSERTFLRQFKEATEKTPSEFKAKFFIGEQTLPNQIIFF